MSKSNVPAQGVLCGQSGAAPLFCCPVCGEALAQAGGALRCKRRHSFDCAAEGYVHLLPVQRMRTKAPGDSPEMVAARRRFLDSGGYACFAGALGELVSGLLAGCPAPVVVDAGCGEGYYTRRLEAALRAAGRPAQVAAFDISKAAVRAAAKRDAEHRVQWAVAGSFAIPLAAAAADCIVDVFSPVAAAEFARVLKPGGALVLAVPGPRHLFGLKQVLYEQSYENAVRDVPYPGFSLESRTPVQSRLTVEGRAVPDLFAMTPYYWKTPRGGAEKLAALETLTTELHFDFLVYRRL